MNFEAILDKLKQSLTNRNVLLVILLLVGALYSPTLLGDFVYDDHLQVEKNTSIRSLTNIPEYFQHSTGYYSKSPASYYRPFHMVAYSLIHIFSRTNPVGYHIVNLLMLVAVGYALFLLLIAWFSRKQAALATLLFLVYPIHVEAVAWIAALPELVSALCVLLVFRWHLKKIWAPLDYLWAGLILCLGILTRENALVLPLLALVFDALDTDRHKNFIQDKLWIRYLVYAFCFAIYFGLRYQALGFLAANPELNYPMSADAMLLNAVYLLSQYFAALVWPPAYSAFHVFEPLASVGEMRFLGVLMIFMTVVFVAGYYYRKQFQVFFYILWIPIAFLPFLYFPALGENVFVERYMFLPSVGSAVLLSALVFQLASWQQGKVWRKLVVLSCLGGVLLWSGLSFVRTLYWKDDIALCTQTVRADPKAYHFYNLLAFAYYQAGDIEQAKTLFASFERMFPARAGNDKDERVAYATVKQLPAKYRHYKQAYFEAQTKLAALHFQLEEFEQAQRIYKQLTELNTTDAELWYYLALCYEQLDQRKEAKHAFQTVLSINPQHVQAQRRIQTHAVGPETELDYMCTQAHQLVEEKKYQEAVAVLQKATREFPQEAKPYHYLFNVYWMTGQKAAAQEAIYQALQRDPDNQLYRYNYESLRDK
jgi:protein O-mannosyl-transferase